ncbi:dihydrodipicolinate synthase family protein [Ihubacter massiliensis]|uniref:Dihydrodipicolinate synthase family protein n=1 Tax=Hominibacterium faecale TaxID=2839743 RepID=A0A9J6QIM1_9FIRM|nr:MULTISPECIES: dihydrodipicolinate synthase family protein [Eubacteriales Family XIII. Incertae Sedis]MCO7122671.1 dihydrodipicolinate synthase family protein [Ihubacter massiliensis]MCU7376945.1 dihydrodipicolinate synthase family protein [Hominibacterium faecale]MCU7379494.1 dihydrodipicolinate synthase family protein [Hominibacterium faecale]MDE8731817.1 dihydrodipicolinate synthase family protein [Eubacteriales bacterium DFI.9.88]
MKKTYQGIIPPIISPIDEKENIDDEGYSALLEYCIENGLHGIFVAGTNGETMALTQKQREHIIDLTLKQVKGRVPVIAGVMDTSTRRVIENIKELESLGGTCAAVTSIFYDRHTSQDETIRHFEKILTETDVDLVIYNIPSFTGIRLTAETVMKIAVLDDRVVAYKDSSGAYGDFMKVLSKYEDTPFSVMQGVTPQALSAVLMGADGFVPALAPAFPKMFVSAYEAARDKNVELTKQYNRLIMESSKILGMTANATAAAKFAISLRGFNDKRVIFPQDTILREEEENIRKKFEEIEAAYQAIAASN